MRMSIVMFPHHLITRRRDIVELPVKEFIKFNNVVDVSFKLLINKVEFVDKWFKLLNIDVDVAFKFAISVLFNIFESDNDDIDNNVDDENYLN
jgi:hypothetical protein